MGKKKQVRELCKKHKKWLKRHNKRKAMAFRHVAALLELWAADLDDKGRPVRHSDPVGFGMDEGISEALRYATQSSTGTCHPSSPPPNDADSDSDEQPASDDGGSKVPQDREDSEGFEEA